MNKGEINSLSDTLPPCNTVFLLLWLLKIRISIHIDKTKQNVQIKKFYKCFFFVLKNVSLVFLILYIIMYIFVIVCRNVLVSCVELVNVLQHLIFVMKKSTARIMEMLGIYYYPYIYNI